ncbi:tetratricopeptide repeat protein [Shewanella zhangzhouensis]|uniref:tetratricopeptide repeat protein n=1 Tax=Shewanella zhangzhouensis TaxID=2864213 RepID=UPI001C65CACC|nr:tetratricopeptide repeat protein [Shewanella zhangzhouensis]QYK05947.1 tetratricopeptide repeat protein [Shewanella zhangzhouensis]
MSARILCCLLLPLLVSCASTSEREHQTSITTLFHDEIFSPVSGLPSPEAVFSLPPSVAQDLRRAFERQRNIPGGDNQPAHTWLSSQLAAADGGFSYQDNNTRIAADTYYDRAGNCMSLVVLAAAMADALGVAVDFQDVLVQPVWDRQGDFYLVNGHVNLRLLPPSEANVVHLRGPILVDFLPERAVRGYDRVRINRSMLLAMFYNNLAAEALINREHDKAYGLIRMSLEQSNTFVPALNTLAILYRYHQREDLAEEVYRQALKQEPENMTTLYNLALILSSQDRLDEWAEVHKVLELARIRNPYYYYDMAEQALSEHEYQQAVNWFLQAVEKADYRHEFYFGLSQAYWASGNPKKAKQSMEKALALSGDDGDKRRYQAKLNAMASH